MKFFLKLEEFLNKVLLSIMGLIMSLFRKILPQKIQDKLQTSKQSIKTKKNNLKDKTKSLTGSSFGKVASAFQKTIEIKDKVKDTTISTVIEVKSIDYKKINYLVLLGSFFLLLLTPFSKLKAWFITLNPKAILGLTTASMLTGLVSINIYTSSKNIAEKKSGKAREPASKVENATALSKRPAYYKRNERELRIRNMTMPVYIGSTKDLRSLTIDFTIISSNKYIKEYFYINTYRIRDRMFSTIEPILPDFPLQKEGKKIIKDKLIRELQTMLKQMKIKGTIQEVHIHSILAG